MVHYQICFSLLIFDILNNCFLAYFFGKDFGIAVIINILFRSKEIHTIVWMDWLGFPEGA